MGPITAKEIKPHRPIRSFVRRGGRLTSAQQQALTLLWPKYGIAPSPAMLRFEAIFGRQAPTVVDIGFGNGEALAALAAAHPAQDYIGIEVHRPGIGRLLLKLEQAQLTNVRIYQGDARELLAIAFPDSALSLINIFFPDPWPKKRHHKRRLIQPDFTALLRSKLKIGGQVHLATDWQDYAGQMLAVMESTAGFENCAGLGNFSDRPDSRPQTKFERRGLLLGHRVYDLLFRRSA